MKSMNTGPTRDRRNAAGTLVAWVTVVAFGVVVIWMVVVGIIWVFGNL